ncbi:MAG: 3'-5' exonuclease, partial [Anaerolineales bacterium]|nr:3'-5' exonuclease [Anaerolineales bacterium]
AMAVIANHPHRKPKQLFTERGIGDTVTLYEAENDHEEADYVARTITELAAGGKARLAECAVMYRTNAQSRVLEETFLRYRLAYKLVGAQRFYGRREVKDVVAYLRLVHNPRDEVSLTRVINTPPRTIGNKTYLALRTQAKATGVGPGEYLLTMAARAPAAASEALSGRAQAALSHFGELLAGWRALRESHSPVQLMDRILQDVDYRAYIDDGTEEGQDRWDNLVELRRLAAEFQAQGLEAFLEQVALVSDQDTFQEGAEAATLLTLHAAKGLEFPNVFIVGLNDGTLPHNRSFEDPEQLEEERRLLYVGVTRAMDRLHLVYARNRNMFGYTEPVAPSRFIDEIPPSLVEFRGAQFGSRRLTAAHSDLLDGWEAVAAPASRALTAQYPPGTHVSHHVWGAGIVLNSKLEDGDEIVDVFFESVGLKRVAASLAKLIILAA